MLAVYAGRQSYVEHRNYLILLCLYDTGIRLRELTDLKTDDVNLSAHTISVVHGKWSKDRKIPVGKTLAKELKAYIPRRNEALEETGRTDKGYLFASIRGGALSPSAVYRGVVRAAGEAAAIQGKRVSPHTWRHTSALHYVLHGGDSFSLQARLGHSTMDMAKHYVNMAFVMCKRCIAAILRLIVWTDKGRPQLAANGLHFLGGPQPNSQGADSLSSCESAPWDL